MLANNKKAFFVTGTDTDCGKTYVSASLIRHLQTNNQQVAGLKPIASGFELCNGDWRNDDVEVLRQASNVVLPEKLANRYSYQPAIAPHIAAALTNQCIDLNLIARDVERALACVDILIVEGVGGWLVPLSIDSADTIETLAQKLKLPIILVVGLRLGCLSHALLTARAILQSGVPFAGWVANHVDSDFDYVAENIASLDRQMPVPKLFELPYSKDNAGFSEIDAFSDTGFLFASRISCS